MHVALIKCNGGFKKKLKLHVDICLKPLFCRKPGKLQKTSPRSLWKCLLLQGFMNRSPKNESSPVPYLLKINIPDGFLVFRISDSLSFSSRDNEQT